MGWPRPPGVTCTRLGTQGLAYPRLHVTVGPASMSMCKTHGFVRSRLRKHRPQDLSLNFLISTPVTGSCWRAPPVGGLLPLLGPSSLMPPDATSLPRVPCPQNRQGTGKTQGCQDRDDVLPANRKQLELLASH